MTLQAATTRVHDVTAQAYTIPTDLPEADGTLAWDSTTIVLVHIAAGDATGLGMTYGPAACAALINDMLAELVRGSDPFQIRRSWQAMVDAVRNIGRPGIASLAISALDLGLWDLAARLSGEPLHRFIGATRDAVPVYGSGGFTTYSETELAAQLDGFLALGVEAVKIKIGEDHGERVLRDQERTHSARTVIGNNIGLFVDANGAYAPHQAVRVASMLEDSDISWFEEPVSSDDLTGLRFVRDHVRPDVAAGEYAYDAQYAHRMVSTGAVDCIQLDVTRCGGITGWLDAAAAVGALGMPVSGHCAPAATLAVATATPHLRHLEWFHDHVRIEQLLFDGVALPRDGRLQPTETPGHGLTLRETTAEQFRVA